MKLQCDVYEASDIQHKLSISKTSAYKLLKEAYEQNGPFRVIKIGTLYRVPKKEFDLWLYGEGGHNYV